MFTFTEKTQREIAALAAAEGTTPEHWLTRYSLDIARAVADRGGIEALEAANAARDAQATTEPETAA